MPSSRIHPGVAAGHPTLAPPVLAGWLAVFRDYFSAPVWFRVLVLVAGAVLAPGKRTVSQALRVMGLAAKPGFSRYHEVLNRARWDGRAVARTLLVHVLGAFLPAGEVVIGVDDTIERRWGIRIKARGLYRDPVRSSRGHFVRASGLRWLSLMVMVPIPWAKVAKVASATADGKPHVGAASGAGGTKRWLTGRSWSRFRSRSEWNASAGAPGRPASQALAAEPSLDRRRRRRLFRRRPDRGLAPPRLPGHPIADRHQPVRAGSATPARADGPPAAEGPAFASAQGGAGRPEQRVVVWSRVTVAEW